MAKKRCIEDDGEAHEIDEIIPLRITKKHSVCSPWFKFFWSIGCGMKQTFYNTK